MQTARRKGAALELRFGIVGSGYMGRTHAHCIVNHNRRARLVAVTGGSRAPALAADYGAAYVPTYEALLARDDIDAVLIATPHIDHCPQTIAAAQACKHIFVEKPMATSVADCTAMIEAANAAGVRLEVIQTQRFRGANARARGLIADGRIGAVRMVEGRSLFTQYVGGQSPWANEEINGGPFLDTGVHFYDLLHFLTGRDVTRVHAMAASYGEAPVSFLNVMTQLAFGGGILGQHWMSYQMPEPSLPNSEHRYLIVGEDGIIDVDAYGKLQLAVGGEWRTVWEQPPIDYVNRPLDPVRLEAFFNQTQSFIDDVLDNRPSTVSGEEGRAAVAVVAAAWQSARTRQPVELG